MWIPTDAQEIEDAARGGLLVETLSFDAKADLPAAKKNIELAKDVAAMATDGGVLLYGVAEDEHGNPTAPEPITLKGAPERVSQIVSTSIAEVPFIDVRPYPLADDPAHGYLAVSVPQSSRAPHMVVVSGDNRFYGRGANGNRILNEGDVARLYERRQRWEVDRDQLLSEVIANSPVAAIERQGYVHAFARPVTSDQGLFGRAVEQLGGSGDMHTRLLQRVHTTELRGRYGPSLEQASFWRRHGADTWRFSTRDEDERNTRDEITSLVNIDVDIDGGGRLFCGRATDVSISDPTSSPRIIEVVIAGNVEAFFTAMDMLYKAASYYGGIDVGIALTGIQGAKSERRERGFNSGVVYPVATYARTNRVSAGQLSEAPALAQELLHHFFDASTGIEGWNPWTQPQNR